MTMTRSTCCYCGVGCGLLIEHEAGRIVGVHGDPDHPANFGRLCSKGSTLHLTATRTGRVLFPELRATRDAARERVSWAQALDTATDRFAAVIREHGPDAVAFYISGQLLTEDYYVFNKLAKGLIGTNNVDSNSRLCMSSAVAGYKQTLGVDAPPACYDDIDHTDCLLIAGANPAYAHPVVFRRIEDAKARNPALKIIVVDPRKTDTAACADLHLPIAPGTDLVLLNAMMNVLIWEGLIDRAYIDAHTEGFDALRDAVRETTPAIASQICDVPADDIVAAARWFGSARAALSMWCQGLNQSTHGTHNTAAIVHLHLATRQMGRPGAGPFSLTGQPNAMGGREVGAMANLLSAHRDMSVAADREWMARFWGVDAVPAVPGQTAVELFDAVRRGVVKAIWIACTNPAQSLPDQSRVREALQLAQFVVVQEAFATTETAQYADLLLPASTWGEKDGTVTNSERRITRVRRAVAAPGEARDDWAIACDFAQRLGARLGKDARRLFPYACAEEIFREHAASTRGRDLDIADLTYAILERDGPQQWPYRSGRGRARLFEDGRFETASGKARFVVLDKNMLAENIDARFPLRLLTGRLRDQWHGMSRTGRAARLYSHVDEPVLSMHRADMRRRDLFDGDYVDLHGRRGTVTLRVYGSDEMRVGQVFVPMHFGARHLSHAGVNELTTPAFDRHSKQPELKHAVVEVRKAALAYQALVLRTPSDARDADERVLDWAMRLQPLLARFRYAAISLAGREHPALSLRIAHDVPLPPEWLVEIDRCVDLPADMCLAYADARRGISKRALLVDGKLAGFRLCGDIAAGAWLRDTVIAAHGAESLRRWLLGPYSAPPDGTTSRGRGRIVCNCYDVAQTEIETMLASGTDLSAVQARLKCGTSCGSCLPELRRLAQRTGVPA